MATSIKKLKDIEIDKKLSRLSSWSINAKRIEIHKSFLFSTFVESFTFVAKIMVHAEVLQHHPTIELSYGKVKVKLTTNDVKGLSRVDFELATKIDNLKLT